MPLNACIQLNRLANINRRSVLDEQKIETGLALPILEKRIIQA